MSSFKVIFLVCEHAELSDWSLMLKKQYTDINKYLGNLIYEKKKQISYLGEFKIIYVYTLLSSRENITPHLLNAVCDFYFLPKSIAWKGEKYTL